MATEHKIAATDSVESIALLYLKDASRWTEIVDYNRLSYPYIVEDELYYDQFRARGYLKVIRNQFESDFTILAGSTFRTQISLASGIFKTYLSVEDLTIPAGKTEAYVFVQCTTAGIFGNTLENSITVADEILTTFGRFHPALTITNAESFTNGKDVNVKFPGDSLFIPTDAEDTMRGISSASTYLNLLGGEDLALDSEGGIVFDTYGDVGSVVGMDNIMQGVLHRLTTERGSNPKHPEYGTGMGDLIGRPQTPYISKLMELDIYESMRYEDRVDKTQINSLTVSGTSIILDATFYITKTSQSQQIKLELDYSKGVVNHVRA